MYICIQMLVLAEFKEKEQKVQAIVLGEGRGSFKKKNKFVLSFAWQSEEKRRTLFGKQVRLEMSLIAFANEEIEKLYKKQKIKKSTAV